MAHILSAILSIAWVRAASAIEPPVTPRPQLATSPEPDDLPCDDGPYILDLCDCGEGLGSSINFHKTAPTYATALGAKYIDLPLRHGEKIESAEPLPDDANVRRANVAAAQPPRSAKK